MQIEIDLDQDVFLPKYRPATESDPDIVILWGGRDSGKTHFIAQSLIIDCLENDYFKCILSRKIQDTIKESQFQTIKSIVNDWGLQDYFDFVSHPLEIRCANGNKFIARGADKGGKVKGVDNPTHAWFEELNQMTKDEYAVVSSTLRSNKTKTKEYWSFNPETAKGDFRDFWLYKIVGENYSDRIEKREIDVAGQKITLTYHIIHSDYNDNPYCPPERKAKYLDTTKGDDYLYTVWINGHWGERAITNPFATQFDEKIHVSKTEHNVNRQLIISIDFNIDPFSANVYNLWNDGIPHAHQVDEIKVQGGTIEKMADEIRTRYFHQLYTLTITGDAMGNNRTIGNSDNKSLFRRLRDELKISDNQFRIKANPRHKTSRDQYNYFLKHFPDYKIGDHCTGTRRDHRVVQVDINGQIIKSDRSQESQLADFLDNSRYFVNTFFGEAIERHRKTRDWR